MASQVGSGWWDRVLNLRNLLSPGRFCQNWVEQQDTLLASEDCWKGCGKPHILYMVLESYYQSGQRPWLFSPSTSPANCFYSFPCIDFFSILQSRPFSWGREVVEGRLHPRHTEAPRPRIEPAHSSDLSHSCDDARSSTHRATRQLYQCL